MKLTWKNLLATIREGGHTIPTTDEGIPLVAVNAPLYELMELVEALTTGYNALVAKDTMNTKHIERIRKLAEAKFPAHQAHQANQPHQKNTYHWVRVSERLPEKSGYYYTYGSNLGIDALAFSSKYKLFNVHDHSTEEDAKKTAIAVTHWCEKPSAPDDTVSADPDEPVAEEANPEEV